MKATVTEKNKSKSAPSILSHDMHVVGKIFSTGDIQIEGRLDGDLRSHAVTIGEKALVSGEVAGDMVMFSVRSKALFAPAGLSVRHQQSDR